MKQLFAIVVISSILCLTTTSVLASVVVVSSGLSDFQVINENIVLTTLHKNRPLETAIYPVASNQVTVVSSRDSHYAISIHKNGTTWRTGASGLWRVPHSQLHIVKMKMHTIKSK